MIKFSKTFKKMFTGKEELEAPVTTEIKAEVVKAEEPKEEMPKAEEPAPAEPTKVEDKHMVECPQCKHSFSVDYDPTEPDKAEEPKTEPEPEAKAEEPVKEEPEHKEEAKAEASTGKPSLDDWKSAMGVSQTENPTTLAFRKAISESFTL